MKYEARQLDPATKRRVLSRLRQYEEEKEALRKRLRACKEDAERRRLFGGRRADDGAGGGASDRGYHRAAQATSRLERCVTRARQRAASPCQHLHASSQSALESARRTMAETEEVGASIVGALGEQRDKLRRAKDRVDETRALANQANQVLRRMVRRAATNKMTVALILVLLVLLIGLLMYLNTAGG